MNRVELLAPAGSFESMKAAINAGCDAVYIGGSSFGARAFADNLDKDRMIEAIEYAHAYNKKLYITINTLIKEDEIKNSLTEYVYPYYKAGVDAVIVQDFGAMKVLHEAFVNLPVHASTQMTITTSLAVDILKRYGVNRIVTPRELSLNEIRRISDESGLEIETFIHGALCYCYSGRCLFSSMIGSRSGNRGRCAQPCRREYIVDDSGKKYVFSPKDMCAVGNIPDMIDAGIASFKIEGRMKKTEYSALVTAIYRKYIDVYYEAGAKDYQRSIQSKEFLQDMQKLMDIYNRGGFCEGFFKEHNSKSFMSMERPNHNGVYVGEVINVKQGSCLIKLCTDVNSQDVLEIRGIYEFTLKNSALKSDTIETRFNRGLNVKKGMKVYRMRNTALIEDIRRTYIDKDKKIKVNIKVIAHKDDELKIIMNTDLACAKVSGGIISKAQNAPVNEASIKKQVSKLGATKYELGDIEIDMDDNIFISMRDINELRRSAIEELERNVVDGFYREDERKLITYTPDNDAYEKKLRLSVGVTDCNMVNIVNNYDSVECIRFELDYFDRDQLITGMKLSKKKNYICLPHILRYSDIETYERKYGDIDDVLVEGYVVRNLEGLIYTTRKKNKRIIADSSLYVTNNMSKQVLADMGADEYTLSYELTGQELKAIADCKANVCIYGNTAVMISANCVHKNVFGCDKMQNKHNIVSAEFKKDEYFVENLCRYCYNIVYEKQPVNLLDESKELLDCGINNQTISFLHEDSDTMKKVLNSLCTKSSKQDDTINKGHFYKGVD